MNNRIHRLPVLFLGMALIVSPGNSTGLWQGKHENDSIADQHTGAPILWREPTDIENRDLFYGIGGKENAPDPSTVYKLVSRAKVGTQPKIIVDDDKGRRWILKIGPEARPETTATRIVWAAGYYVDQDYFLPSVRIDDGKTRTVEINVRLERFEPADTDLGNWSWDSNPFSGTRELDGLKALVALLRDV